MIERISGCSPDEFQSRYLGPRRPVVLTDLARNWEGAAHWTPAMLASRFGERKVEVRRGGKLYLTPLKSYVRYLEAQAARAWSSPGPSNDLIYLHALVIAETLPELLDEFSVPPHFLPNWMECSPLADLLPSAVRSSSVLFVGPAGARSATHRDHFHTHAWLTQIYGQKQFVLLAPERHPACYENASEPDRSLIDDFEGFDGRRYPLVNLNDLSPVRLSGGETLFIPAGWWHGAKCLSTSISLSANFVNSSNFADFSRDSPLPLAPEELAALVS